MPQRLQWDPGFEVGHEDIDAQHRGLLVLCERLAGHCLQGGGAAHEQRFVALWCLGHITASAARLRARLARG